MTPEALMCYIGITTGIRHFPCHADHWDILHTGYHKYGYSINWTPNPLNLFNGPCNILCNMSLFWGLFQYAKTSLQTKLCVSYLAAF